METLRASDVAEFEGGDCEKEQDADLQASALHYLQSSGYRSLWLLHCEVVEGVVILSGVVSSFYLKQMAQALVQRMDTIKGVQNRIKVLAE
jgi:hypothetical protein